METHLFDRGIMENRNQPFTLNQDKLTGFKNAVNNGQVRLALEYSQSIIVDLVSRISELEKSISLSEKTDVKDENVEPKKPLRSSKTTAKSEQATPE
jgi:hypothetical protein